MIYFVYGTLKSGFGNNRILGNSKFLGNSMTEGLLYESGIPFFVPNQSKIITYGSLDYSESKKQYDKYKDDEFDFVANQVVHGELYEVKDEHVWLSLDVLESYYSEDVEKNLYFRCLYPVMMDRRWKPAWVYGVKNDLNRFNLKLNPTGRYKKHAT